MQEHEKAKLVAIIIILIFAFFVLFPTFAKAHMAEAGWAYDSDCCGGDDCRQAKEGEIEWSPMGWMVHAPMDGQDTQLVPFDDERVHSSKDRFIHVCISYDYVNCLYIPDLES